MRQTLLKAARFLLLRVTTILRTRASTQATLTNPYKLVTKAEAAIMPTAESAVQTPVWSQAETTALHPLPAFSKFKVVCKTGFRYAQKLCLNN
jgi:hypothetical protein